MHNTKVSGTKPPERDTEEATRSGAMEAFTKVTGKMTRQMEREGSSMLMATFTMDTGRMIKLMGSEAIPILTVQNTKGTGKMISSTEKDRNSGLMAHSTLAATNMGKRMALASSFGPTSPLMTVNSLIIIFTAKESIDGPMAENTLETGSTIKCTVKESLPGLIKESTRASTTTTKNKVTVYSHGQMAGSMMANG
jgi:hypothetical protein